MLADAGVENVNAQVDDLITTGVLRRVLAFTELKFSNSMIEAWWRSLKHQWLFLHSLDSVTTVRRLVAFYVDEHNRVLPHSAFRGQTPDEMYFGTGDAVPADLTARAAAARRTRVKPTDRRRARHARQSTRPRDQGVLTAFRPPGPAGPCVWRRRPRRTGPRGRTSRWAEPCPGSASFSRSRPCRLNDENSRAKVQNVRADSSAERRATEPAEAPRNRARGSRGLQRGQTRALNLRLSLTAVGPHRSDRAHKLDFCTLQRRHATDRAQTRTIFLNVVTSI